MLVTAAAWLSLVQVIPPKSPQKDTLALADTLVVTSADDDGPGTLRAALGQAGEGATVTFDPAAFPSMTPVTIYVRSLLPIINHDAIVVDGSDAGVVLDGSLCGLCPGLSVIGARGVTIRGLQIVRFGNNGIVLFGGTTGAVVGGDRSVGAGPLGQGNLLSGNAWYGIALEDAGTDSNRIEGNFVGTDLAGLHAWGNGAGGVGINNGASGNVIGGVSESTGNLVSGNSHHGIVVTSPGSSDNRIIGNRIGTTANGENAVPNSESGVAVYSGASRTTVGGSTPGSRNIISGNDGNGVSVQGANTVDTLLLGNYIGTDVAGVSAVGNRRVGVAIAYGATGMVVGGANRYERNVVSANGEGGILLQGATGVRILGNLVGTDASGMSLLGNGRGGIAFSRDATQNTLGGTGIGEGNVIGGNDGPGVYLKDEGTWGNRVVGNHIGTDRTGKLALGNTGAGVKLSRGATGNRIGGDLAGEGNFVRFSGGDGIALLEATTSNNIVSGNTVEDSQGTALVSRVGNTVTGNIFRRNASNIALIIAGTLTPDGESWEVQGDLAQYNIVREVASAAVGVEVPAGATWTVGAGTDVRFDFGLGAEIGGTLEAHGTITAPVRFGSAQLNAAPVPGDWHGLAFEPGSRGRLEHASVEFGQTGLDIDDAEVDVVASTVAASGLDGIRLSGSGRLNITDSTVASSGRFGLNNLTDVVVDAREIWWGHASGPDRWADKVQGPVDYSSWKTDPGFNDSWRWSAVLNPGEHAFTINSFRDLDWFRMAARERNATITVTLAALPGDYDLFLFHQLGMGPGTSTGPGSGRHIGPGSGRHIGAAMSLTDLDSLGSATSHGQAMTIGQLGQAGDGFDAGKMIQVSTNNGTSPEAVSAGVWDQTGWYHVLVAGHNGANSQREYAMAITVTAGAPAVDPGFAPTSFTPPDQVNPEIRTLLLTNTARLKTEHGVASTEQLLATLHNLATHNAVEGVVVDLSSSEPIASAYELWDDHPTNPVHANLVSSAIEAMLAVTRTAYPNLEYLVIAGGDDIVPFRRVPDEVMVANEADYDAHLQAATPLGVALGEHYFLSDDYYGMAHGIPWRGRQLALPSYGLGRLVETPEEMIAAVEGFYDKPVVDTTRALVTGYDFLTDMAWNVAREMTTTITTPPIEADTVLIGDEWTADALGERWLATPYNIRSINAHFEHWRAIPADRSAGDVVPHDVASSTVLRGTLGYSVGCHAGLNVPGRQARDKAYDFPQAVLSRGGMWIANTGYGFGDADTIGLSERLAVLMTRRLTQGQSAGHALRLAKADYLAETGIRSFSPYDEKVLAQMTLYGLPMVRLDVPERMHVLHNSADNLGRRLGEVQSVGDLTAQRVMIAPLYVTHTLTESAATGSYFGVRSNLDTSETEVNEGQPIQPRTSVEIGVENMSVSGAFFEGGRYRTLTGFDPVVTRVVTETTNTMLGQREPEFSSQGSWHPSRWAIISSGDGSESPGDRLVVIPAQFRSDTEVRGTQRLFDEMQYTVYYTATNPFELMPDIIPPSIWRVQAFDDGAGHNNVHVEVTDRADVVRVGVTYTYGDGQWITVDLARAAGDPNSWIGVLPRGDGLEWFVQAVDGVGNVATSDNKGAYFSAAVEPLRLPVAFKGAWLWTSLDVGEVRLDHSMPSVEWSR